MNLLTRFFVCLSLLLFTGHSRLHAIAAPVTVVHLSSQQIHSADQTNLVSLHTKPSPVIKYAPLYSENENDKIEVTDNEDDEEDDELVSLGKYVSANNYFATFFRTRSTGYFREPVQSALPSFQHVSMGSSYRYIMLCVIRI